jgi:hypothetical protein
MAGFRLSAEFLVLKMNDIEVGCVTEKKMLRARSSILGGRNIHGQ